MTFDPELAERRLPVWRPLSELFLDNELQEGDYERIAAAITESGLSVPEVETILWDEVFPALGVNLQVTAGAWAGFDDESLVRRIVAVQMKEESGLGVFGLLSAAGVREIIEEAWTEVLSHLDARSAGDEPA